MPGARRAPIIPLTRLLAERRPELTDPIAAILDHRVIVDGRTVANPRAVSRDLPPCGCCPCAGCAAR